MSKDRGDANEKPGLSRRDALKSGLSLSAAAMLAPSALARLGLKDNGRNTGPERPYLDAALKAGEWIKRSAIADENGTRWPADPNDPKSVHLDLYNGTTGVVPFWLELHHATKDMSALKQASAGADYLCSVLPTMPAEDAGLYTGLAGIGWVLSATHRATKNAKHAQGAARALEMIKSGAKPDPSGKGVIWSDSTDIISGSAGIGLYLLWAHKELRDAGSLDVAARAGHALIAAGEPTGGGLRWKINAGMKRNYPNFSHGTAGVSYFLASLHQTTDERAFLDHALAGARYLPTDKPAFLDAALAGARYLQSLATTTPNGGRMIFHSEPGNEQIFYLSWCHGPGGTARLFHRLGAITQDASYGTYVDQLATAIVDMKVPDQSPGYWNNISQCCGNCGVTEFFTSMHTLRHDARHLEFAERVARNTLSRGAADGDGLKWIQAENRVSPDDQVAQTGLMQGAAGVGLAMLHLDGAINRRKPAVLLPDNPFV